MGKTTKPYDIIVDEALYDHPLIQELGEKGHTVKKLLSHGYDIIIAPKAYNLTMADLESNPKLLQIALDHVKAQKKATAKVKEIADVVEDTQTPAGEDAKGDTKEVSESKPAPRKRKPRAKKSPAPVNESAGQSDSSSDSGAGAEGGAK